METMIEFLAHVAGRIEAELAAVGFETYSDEIADGAGKEAAGAEADRVFGDAYVTARYGMQTVGFTWAVAA